MASIVGYAGIDIITTANKASFAKDIKKVYEAVEEYYGVNGDIPVVVDGISMDVTSYKRNIADDEYLEALTMEITDNDDSDATFYEVDLSKIGIDEIGYGIKKRDNDVFLVSNKTHTIYYYAGQKFGKDIFFSNASIVNKK